MKKYIWINPVIISNYEIEYLKEILNDYTIIYPENNHPKKVRDEYDKKCKSTNKCVIDSRCPKISEYIDKNEKEYEYANINPILIETSLELYNKKSKEDYLFIITPCTSLADLGNSLNLENTLYITWKDFIYKYNINLDINKKKVLDDSPIPLGFFSELEHSVYSVSGEENIENMFKNKKYRDYKLIEALYCDGGCHNGNGV